MLGVDSFSCKWTDCNINFCFFMFWMWHWHWCLVVLAWFDRWLLTEWWMANGDGMQIHLEIEPALIWKGVKEVWLIGLMAIGFLKIFGYSCDELHCLLLGKFEFELHGVLLLDNRRDYLGIVGGLPLCYKAVESRVWVKSWWVGSLRFGSCQLSMSIWVNSGSGHSGLFSSGQGYISQL